MNKYDCMTFTELVDLLNAKDAELRIVNSACDRIAKEQSNWERKALELANYLDMTRDDIFKNDKHPDSGYEESELFPKGEGKLVFKNQAGTIYSFTNELTHE